MSFLRHEVPRKTTGTKSVYCRTCGREIARAAQLRITSIGKCAYCELVEKGVKNPEDYVLPQYIMTDPTKPPIPIGAEGEDAVILLFPEEEQEGPKPMAGGIMGTAKSIFRAFGFGKDKEQASPESKQVATRRRKGSSLYD